MARKPVINQELANSFRSMVGYPAWKHLEAFMSAMQVEAVEREDSTPLNELTVAHIGEVRGIRKVITAIHEEIAQYLKD